MKPHAILFDMDGLLIDSSIYWLELEEAFFAQHNIALTRDIIKHLIGKSQKENMQWLVKEFGLTQRPEVLVNERQSLIDEMYHHKTMMMPGADALIKLIAQSDKKQAIASGAHKEWIDIVTTRFGWTEYLDEALSVEHVGHKGKPEPDVFLYAAEKLGVKPEDCVVFEDAENGVVAAKRAGMTCIAVPDKRWSHGDFSQADFCVDSLEDRRVFAHLAL